MKGKLPSMVMVVVALVMALSLVATVAITPSEQTEAATDSWSRMDLPSTLEYQMFPDSDIWDLTAADDGTLFALVEDTTGDVDIISGAGNMTWDGLRWAVYPAYSDVALMKSVDGGHTWDLMWHMPASEAGAPIAVVPQPGYVEGDAANDVVFVATGSRYISTRNSTAGGLSQGNLYRSLDGGNIFTRITPRNPAVTTGTIGGTITSLDVAEDMNVPGEYLAVVGVSSLNTSTNATLAKGEGVYTWNEGGHPVWQDKQVVNALPPAPFPGTMPAGRGMDVVAVMFSPDYTNTGQIVAVVNDINSTIDTGGQPRGIYVCLYDAVDGCWGGDVDSPTNAVIGLANAAGAACIATSDAHIKFGSIYVGIDGAAGVVDDVYYINTLSTVTGPSVATATGLFAAPSPDLITDIVVDDAGNLFVGCEFPLLQAQVFKGVNVDVWPAWTPSVKPPSGRWPVLLTQGSIWAAGGSDGVKNTSSESFTTSGVHVMVDQPARGPIYNGVGLLDDIAVSEDIPGYVSPYTGTWCLAEAVAEEVSPSYATDNLIYVATYSEWDGNCSGGGASHRHPSELSLWRWDGTYWERVMYENLRLPTNVSFAGKNMLTTAGRALFVNDWTWWPRVTTTFSDDPYVFLLGGVANATAWVGEWLWYSPDKGDTWIRVFQMPIGAIGAAPGAAGLSETGWWVQDNNTVFCGDVAGWVYKTTDRGASWTDGALTASALEVTYIQTSPIYSEAGSDKCILVGTFDNTSGMMEVWLSQDGAIDDLENVCAEVNTDPGPAWNATYDPYGMTVCNFDADWGTNHWVYAAASGYLDRWQLVGPGATELTRIDSSDVGVYRAEIELSDPSASTWRLMWSADDFNNAAPKPQPLPNMTPGQDVFRRVTISDLRIGHEGSIYAPFALWDMSYNNPARAPSPNSVGRHTLGGVLRCLDGTQATTEWNLVNDGLGVWDGLWLNRAPAGASNTLISLAWDWQEWRFKLPTYDDTLCQAGPAPVAPLTGDAGVGTLDAEVSVNLQWSSIGAANYEWQVDDDCGFITPLKGSDQTTETFATVTGLEPGVAYCWRVRAVEPVLSPWCTGQSFTTVIGAELLAPVLVSPAAGATIIDTTPLFQWGAIGWATSYRIQVATDSGFSTTVIDQTLANNVYEAPSNLGLGTYYWRVMAMSATSQTDWSAGSFTIASVLPQAQTQPWVWAVIAIGSVLLIAVIGLIVRTRRAV